MAHHAAPAEPEFPSSLAGLSAAAFGELLREHTGRVMRYGLTLSQAVAAANVAEHCPGVFAAAYDRDGRIVWTSASFGSILGFDSGKVLGRAITELFPPDWCEERLALLRRSLATGTPIPTIEIFRGVRVEGVILPIAPESPDPAVLFLGRHGLGLGYRYAPSVGGAADEKVGAGSGGLTIGAQTLIHADWGPLSTLTRRELETLRLIAAGLDNDQIAHAIHRTKRAVEWHIRRLYSDLDCDQRTDLFRLGLEAGLPDIDDRHWACMMAHVRFVPDDHADHEHGPRPGPDA